MKRGLASKFAFVCLLLLSAVFTLILAAGAAWAQLGPALSLSDPEPPQRSVIFTTAQGEPFARRGEYREAPVVAESLPAHVIAPFLAIEDRRFYEHGGLDLRGIARAAVANILSEDVEQGGSTITQQFAKLAFVGNERSYTRKLKEAFIALRLEKQYSKHEILSAYLNRIYFGDGVYGIGAAARHYFAKRPHDLEIAEAAMLAGVINAPSRLAPTLHPGAARQRAATVLQALVDAEYLTAEDAHSIGPAQVQPSVPLVPDAGYFADWARPQLNGADTHGYGSITVPTTLDGALQQRAVAVISQALAKEGSKRRASQAALVAMRADGSVVAMVGGLDYKQSQFNRAVQAQRQPGSAFKLFVYLAALRAGADAEMLVEDRPLKVDGWSPRNAGGRYEGSVSLTRAFSKSSNVAAVRLSEAVGRDAVIRAAQDLGLSGDMKPVPSLALGALPTTLLDLTAAYAGVASGIYPIAPTGMPRPDHANFSSAEVQMLMSPRDREQLLAMLSSAVESGTGRAARLPIPAYGKTGTTQNSRDAWFIGFAGDLVVGVWVGNDDEAPMKGVTGGSMPATIWREFMTSALDDEIAAEEFRKTVEAARESDYRNRFDQEEDQPWWDRILEPVRRYPRFW